MSIILNIFLLLVGFALLIKGADVFVDGASDLAKKLGIPSLVVGLTIVAMGTSAPELAVSVSASVKGSNALSVGNVIGSNIFNLLVVLGFCSLFKPVKVTKELLKRDYPVCIGATVLFMIFLFFGGDLTRIEAAALVLLMIGYIALTVRSALKDRTQDEEKTKDFSAIKCLLSIVLGAAAIVFGGDMVVDNAEKLGDAFGMSEALIGLTICAIGTSLPELVTSIVAAKKGQTDMAMGNVVGSNIFNLLFILGVSGTISPILIDSAKVFNTLADCAVCLGVSVLAYVFCFTGKKIVRWEGGVFLALYVAYMAYIIVRDMGLAI